MVLNVLGILALGAAVPSEVTSADGRITVMLDLPNAEVSSLHIKSRGGAMVKHDVRLFGGIDSTIVLDTKTSTNPSAPGSVTVSRLLCIRGGDVPCSDKQAWVNLTFAPAGDSVELVLTAEGGVETTGGNVTREQPPTWTAPVTLSASFTDTSALKLWAPWNRGSSIDPLLPSDGHFSWWDGSYAHGSPLHGGDYVIAEHVTVLHPASGVAFSLIGDPSNAPSPLGTFQTFGPTVATAGSSAMPARFSHSYASLRLQPGVKHVRRHSLVPHADACWRPSVAWSQRQYSEYWRPNSAVKLPRQFDGLGSYSSYQGPLTDPNWKKMGYQTSWDLSGRFFPYMGQFLPPMPNSAATWSNDREGTQPKVDNVSFSSIDEYYATTQREGFSTLSYFNVFEYGINIVVASNAPVPSPPSPPAPLPLNENHWKNASRYLADNFRSSLVTKYVCAYGDPCSSKSFSHPHEGKQGSWQGSVVVDPRTSLGYQRSLISQVRRKIKSLPHFQGLVVDRSDWNQMVNLDGDDGKTWVANGSGWSMKHSYLEALAAAMFCNTVGFGWLPFMKAFDGIYAEGGDVNAAGMLGMSTTSIMWTYGKEMDTAPDDFFQSHLRMGVFPMAPFPGNDHSITPTPARTAMYLKYGALFNAIKGAEWLLDANAVTVASSVGVSSTERRDTPATTRRSLAANAFVAAGSDGSVLLFPVVFGNTTESEAHLTARGDF